jgi:hypothetical protein
LRGSNEDEDPHENISTHHRHICIARFAHGGRRPDCAGRATDGEPRLPEKLREVSWQNRRGAPFFAGPSLVSEKTTSTSADDFRDIITNGKHHMPKFAGKLTSEEIDTLVQQIKAPKK